MKKNSYGQTITTVVDGSTRTGLLAADGSLNIVIVDGSSFVGTYHACGAANAVVVDGSSLVGVYHPSGAINVIVDSTGTGTYHASGALHVTTAGGAFLLLAGETDGLAYDFTDRSANIVDSSTPANNYASVGYVSDGSFVGPGGSLTYTSPSAKLCLQEDGYYSYGAHNLCLQSEDFSTTWSGANTTVSTNVATAPNGTLTADLVYPATTGTFRDRGQQHASAIGIWRVSCYIKAAGFTWAFFRNMANSGLGAHFDLSTGSVGTVQSGYSATITDVGGGWYLCEMIRTGSAVTGPWITVGMSDADNSSTATVNGTDGIYVWGGQLQFYPTETDYIKTTTTAKYALPYTYDTSNALEGILVEEARTNMLTYSGDQTNAAWITATSSVAASAVTSPTGNLDAYKITEDSTAGVRHDVYNSFTATAAAYTASVYAKAGERNWLFLRFAISGTFEGAWFNLSTGAVGTTSAGYTAGIEDVGNGWYRCYVTKTATAATWFVDLMLADADGSYTYNGDGSSGLHVWLPQAELGSFPTSPIRTYGSTATRAVDDVNIATTAFPFDAATGTLYAYGTSLAPITTTSVYGFASLNNDSINEEYLLYHYNDNLGFRVYDGGGSVADVNNGTALTSNSQTVKVAGAYALNDIGFAENGTPVSPDTSNTLPTPTQLTVGGYTGYTSGALKIKAISYVPRRKDDIELAVATGYSLPSGYALYGAWSLYGTESSALAFDFTDKSVVNTKTPLVSQGTFDTDGTTLGPQAALTYTSPSVKMVKQADGWYKYGAHNLFLQSEDITDASWTTTNVTVTGAAATTPDGSNADQIQHASVPSQVVQAGAITTVAGATYRYSFTFKSVSGGGFFRTFLADGLISHAYGGWINLTTGAWATVSTVGTNMVGVDYGIESLGDGWYRGYIEGYLTSLTNMNIWVYLTDTDNTTTRSTTPVVYLSQMQLERVPSVTDYVKTTSAAVYGLPYQYASGSSEGLLIEEARTNLQTYNTQFDNVVWTKTRMSVSADDVAAPDGTTTADKLIPATDVSTTKSIRQTVTVTAATDYAHSFYVKPSGTMTRFGIVESSVSGNYGSFDCTGDGSVIATTGSSGGNSTCVNVGNDWYRITFVCNGGGGGSANINLYVMDSSYSSGNPSSYGWTADGTSGVHAWGAQSEVGVFPTSPISTYSATATRAADNVGIATTAFPHNATTGSMFAQLEYKRTNTTGITKHTVSTGSAGRYIYATGTNINTYDGTNAAAFVSGAYAANTDYKFSVAQGSSTMSTATNGSIVVSGGTYDDSMATGTLELGNDTATEYDTVLFKKLVYVPRKKSEAEQTVETT